MSKDERIRIMIVEDHFVVRVGLAAIINSQPDMVTVAESSTLTVELNLRLLRVRRVDFHQLAALQSTLAAGIMVR